MNPARRPAHHRSLAILAAIREQGIEPGRDDEDQARISDAVRPDRELKERPADFARRLCAQGERGAAGDPVTEQKSAQAGKVDELEPNVETRHGTAR